MTVFTGEEIKEFQKNIRENTGYRYVRIFCIYALGINVIVCSMGLLGILLNITKDSSYGSGFGGWITLAGIGFFLVPLLLSILGYQLITSYLDFVDSSIQGTLLLSKAVE